MALNRLGLDVALRALVCCFAAQLVDAASAANPYQGICDRNVFHLRPAPTTVLQAVQAPLPRVHLMGITTILRGKRALLKVEFPPEPAERAKEESYILTEGQRAGPIEVLEINEKKDQVRLDNSGTITNITFEKIAPAPVPPQASYRFPGLPYRRANR